MFFARTIKSRISQRIISIWIDKLGSNSIKFEFNLDRKISSNSIKFELWANLHRKQKSKKGSNNLMKLQWLITKTLFSQTKLFSTLPCSMLFLHHFSNLSLTKSFNRRHCKTNFTLMKKYLSLKIYFFYCHLFSLSHLVNKQNEGFQK